MVQRSQPRGGREPPSTAHSPDAIENEIRSLTTMDLVDLRARWKAVHRRAPPPGLYRDLMVRSLAYKLQAEAYGDLDLQTKKMLAKLAKGDCSALDPEKPLLKPGTILVREWGKTLHHITVLDKGFSWNGKTYPSLSASARAITGTNWNGYAFFGLKPRPNRKNKNA
jgi:Protein of unknown function (DUF2924)